MRGGCGGRGRGGARRFGGGGRAGRGPGRGSGGGGRSGGGWARVSGVVGMEWWVGLGSGLWRVGG